MKNQIYTFDMFAMVHPKNDRDLAMMLDEAIEGMRTINLMLTSLLQEEAPAVCR